MVFKPCFTERGFNKRMKIKEIILYIETTLHPENEIKIDIKNSNTSKNIKENWVKIKKSLEINGYSLTDNNI